MAGLLVVVASVALAVRPVSHDSLPATRPLAPGEGIPATIHDVQPWLPSLGATTAPPVAYVYVLPYGIRPIALSVDGSYRYLPAAPDPYTDGEMTSFAVSPDGLHLAVAWSGSAGSEQTPAHAVVYAYDLTTGDRRGPWLGQGLASQITGLAWRWDGSGLAWEEFRADEPDGSAGTARVVVLDWSAGTRKDLESYIGPVAWAPDGRSLVAQRAEVGAGFQTLEIVPIAGGDPTRLPESMPGPVAWSPDGRWLAGVGPCESQNEWAGGASACVTGGTARVVLVDVGTGATTERALSGVGPDATVLGWHDGQPVVGGGTAQPSPEDWSGAYAVRTVVASGPGAALTGSPDPRIVNGLMAAQQVLATAPVVDLPPPAQPRFGPLWWSWEWHRRPAFVVLLLLALGVVAFLGVRLGRLVGRRRVSPRPRRL